MCVVSYLLLVGYSLKIQGINTWFILLQILFVLDIHLKFKALTPVACV